MKAILPKRVQAVKSQRSRSYWGLALMAMTVTMFLTLVSPLALCGLKSVSDLAQLKLIKDKHLCHGRCIHNSTSKYPCKNCSRLKQRMCRGYHGLDSAEQELICRIVYEYMFGFITFTHITSSTWMDSTIRDWGHHERLQRLLCKIDPSNCTSKWIKLPTEVK